MKNLEVLNQDKRLEIKVLDEYDNFFYANKFAVDFLDENNNLSKLSYAKKIEVYFEFNIEDKENSNLKANELYEYIKHFTLETIDLTVAYEYDNWETESFEIKEYENKIVMTLKVDTIFEDLLPVKEAVEMFYDSKANDEVVEFVYEDFKEEIYKTYNVKTLGDFIALTDSNNEKLDNDDLALDLQIWVESKVRLTSFNNQVQFIKDYLDKDFKTDEEQKGD